MPDSESEVSGETSILQNNSTSVPADKELNLQGNEQ